MGGPRASPARTQDRPKSQAWRLLSLESLLVPISHGAVGGRAHPARDRASELKAGGPKGVTLPAGPWGSGVGGPLVPVHICLAS